MRCLRRLVPMLACCAVACTSAPHPAPPADGPATAVIAPADVWTRAPGVALRGDSASVVLPYAAMRLQVLRNDSAGLLVRCLACVGYPVGRVDTSALVSAADVPLDSAAAGDLATFVVALRAAAQRHDLPALRRVMAADFVHAPDGPDGVLEALAAWQANGFRTLDRLSYVLDRGVAPLRGAPGWAAPPEYVAREGFRGLRTGFRQERGRWVWLFLVPSR